MPRCPPSYLREDAVVPALNAITGAWQDWDRGVIRGWPDGLAGWVEEGVRQLDVARAQCQEAVFERRRQSGPKEV